MTVPVPEGAAEEDRCYCGSFHWCDECGDYHQAPVTVYDGDES
jgi:hypothetical protein